MNSKVSVIVQTAFGKPIAASDVSTVQDVLTQLNLGAQYQATNKKTGEILSPSSYLQDGDFIILSEKVKGA